MSQNELYYSYLPIERALAAAEAGDIEAMVHLGHRFTLGHGGASVDRERGAYWFRRAAQAGDPYAYLPLLRGYRSGFGPQADMAEARRRFHLAAEDGDLRALSAMVELHLRDQASREDVMHAKAALEAKLPSNSPTLLHEIGSMCSAFGNREEAIEWFRRAADLGNLASLDRLGTEYGNSGSPEGYTQSMVFVRKAAEAGYVPAMKTLALLLRHSENLDERPEAIQWTIRAAENGDPAEMRAAAKMYLTGEGVPLNYETAARWYLALANMGDMGGMFHIAYLYRMGRGVPQDMASAGAWMARVSEPEHPIGQYFLGRLYMEADGEARDMAKGVLAMRQAADLGFRDAISNLAHLYATSFHVDEDLDESRKWFQILANRGESDGMRGLASLAVRQGTIDSGGTKTYDTARIAEAIYWYRRAAEEHSDEVAWLTLARAYRRGLWGLAVNLPEARAWYLRAAKIGNTVASKELGELDDL